MCNNWLKNTLAWSLLLVLLVGCAGQTVQEPEPAQTNPELAKRFAREGQLALEQGRRNAAAEAWQKAVELDPGNAVVVNNLALVMKDQHSFAEAAKLLAAKCGMLLKAWVARAILNQAAKERNDGNG